VTFSERVKNELVRRKKDECPECAYAELGGFVHTAGSISILGRQRLSVTVEVDRPAIARRVFTLVKRLFGVHSVIAVRRSSRLGRHNTYVVNIPPSAQVTEVVRRLHVLDDDSSLTRGIPSRLVGDKCCQRAYLRGAFVVRGYVNDPVKGYHLEVTSNSFDHASDLVKLTTKWDIKAKTTEHKQRHILYVKGADDVSRFLQVIGADMALLEFENVRAMKDVRNQVNREVNCETANVNKTVEAAARQIDDIRLIDREIGIRSLKKSLQDVAVLRLEMPSATMEELGQALTPAVSKSTVSYRFKRIAAIADEIRKQQRGHPLVSDRRTAKPR